MRWSIRLGRLFGVPVYLHLTFLLLLGLVGLLGLFQGGPAAAIGGVLMIASVFGCVLLHEFGHILAARRYGIPTQDVILLPIGGVARLARMPDEPKQELVVALAGPAVNVAIAAMLFPLISLGGGAFLAQLFAINVLLFLFNMLPAFPMDGGRVLRALLARQMSYVRATDIAATIGKGMAVLLAVAGLVGVPGLFGSNPMLLVIAWFVWSGAGREAAMVRRSRSFDRPTAPQPAGTVHEAEVVWSPPSDQPGTDGRSRGRHYRVGPLLVHRDE
jgi:Zn-dependent protease